MIDLDWRTSSGGSLARATIACEECNLKIQSDLSGINTDPDASLSSWEENHHYRVAIPIIDREKMEQALEDINQYLTDALGKDAAASQNFEARVKQWMRDEAEEEPTAAKDIPSSPQEEAPLSEDEQKQHRQNLESQGVPQEEAKAFVQDPIGQKLLRKIAARPVSQDIHQEEVPSPPKINSQPKASGQKVMSFLVEAADLMDKYPLASSWAVKAISVAMGGPVKAGITQFLKLAFREGVQQALTQASEFIVEKAEQHFGLNPENRELNTALVTVIIGLVDGNTKSVVKGLKTVGNLRKISENKGEPGQPQRIVNTVSKSESPIWKSLKPYQKRVKTNGEKGKKERLYEWDGQHKDIEVYDGNKKHLGSMDPLTGEMCKPAKPGRKLDI